MSNIARATTDASGRAVKGSTIHSGMRTEEINKRKKEPFSIDIRGYKECHLGDLLKEGTPFNMLASYLVNEKKYYANSPCEYARSGTIRSIRIKNREFRADLLNIWEKRQ